MAVELKTLVKMFEKTNIVEFLVSGGEIVRWVRLGTEYRLPTESDSNATSFAYIYSETVMSKAGEPGVRMASQIRNSS